MATNLYMKRKIPRDLQDMCLTVIAENFDILLSSPISERATKLLKNKSQELLGKFLETDGLCVSSEHAQFCVNSYLKELNCQHFQLCDQPILYQYLGNPECTVTTISNPRYVSLDMLWDLIRCLPNSLASLSLAGTHCEDSMLETIAQRCPNLRELDLFRCHNISNSGIRTLCRKDKNGSILPNTELRCIDLRLTRVGEGGITFALEHFLNLSEIKHDNLGQVIWKKHRNVSRNVPNFNVYNLKSAIIKRTSFPHDEVLMAFNTLCPGLTTLETAIVTPAELALLTEFSSLTNVTCNIRCNLLPFLKVRGNFLKDLTIFPSTEFLSLSLEALVELCPILECLALYEPKFARLSFPMAVQHNLPFLTELRISGAHPDNLAEVLVWLLSRSPKLKGLTLVNTSSQFTSSSFLNSLIELDFLSTLDALRIEGVNVSETERTTLSSFGVNVISVD